MFGKQTPSVCGIEGLLGVVAQAFSGDVNAKHDVLVLGGSLCVAVHPGSRAEV